MTPPGNEPHPGTAARRGALVVAILALTAASGCGGGSDTAADPPAPAAERAPSKAGKGEDGLPSALAANRAQANQILDDGALAAKLEQLHGHPIVVNQWASWCPPCRGEFPYFQQAAETYADEVAFLGIDMQDDRGAAQQFLAEQPVPYPSVFDPDAEQIRSLGGGRASPTTVFIDAGGHVVGMLVGPYVSIEQLNADIERYLLS